MPTTSGGRSRRSAPHAVISAAGEVVLHEFFKKDRFDFAVTSEVLPSVQRSFDSFSAAAEEASSSRVFAGAHFRFDLTTGQWLGRDIARFFVQNFLRPPRRDDDGGDGR